jgi:hypothetical protein
MVGWELGFDKANRSTPPVLLEIGNDGMGFINLG